MKQITGAIVGMAFGCGGIVSNVAQASVIQSMTIEEIGLSSGGLGTSATRSGGGFGDWIPSSGVYTPAPAFFVSAGSTDGALVMGTTQGNGKFTLGTVWRGNSIQLNTLHGAPTGAVVNDIMTLDFSGLVAEFPTIDLTFKIAPDAQSLVTTTSVLDADHHYFTADWTYFIVGDGDVYHTASGILALGWEGSTIVMHMEGIATLAPIPEAETYTMMLVGLGLVGFMARHRSTVKRNT